MFERPTSPFGIGEWVFVANTKPFARSRPMSKELRAKRENKELASQALHHHLSLVAIKRPLERSFS